MVFKPYNRDVYLGEPVDSLEVNQGDSFYLGLNLFDDQGAVWGDSNWTTNIFFFMSKQDTYAGDNTFINHFSGTPSAGVATIFISSSGTAVPGLYRAEIIMNSGSGASAVEVTAGIFEFNVIGD